MAVLDSYVLADRIKSLLEQYLNDEVDTIDTASNALTSGEGSFTTPTIASTAILVGFDDAPELTIRVVIRPEGRADAGELRYYGTSARIDTLHGFTIDIHASTADAAWGDTGAARRADRVCRAIESVITAYPRLDVPDASPALAAIDCAWCEHGTASTGFNESDNEHRSVVFSLPVTVRIVRTRS